MTAQDQFHGAGFDYVAGSPHLRHDALRGPVARSLGALVERSLSARSRCRVLELGAGHGNFTASLAHAGASVVVTEMSRASADVLNDRFHGNAAVTVVYDRDGEWIFGIDEAFDVVACVSVLHHIPDYLRAVARLCDLLASGGSLACWQDPLWYPTMPRYHRAISTGAYFVWRLCRGDLRRGAGTRLRRLRRTYDETNPYDMAEYHVVRQGVDEAALVRLLRERFGRVELTRYWSTQASSLQSLGERLRIPNTFGIEAIDRIVER